MRKVWLMLLMLAVGIGIGLAVSGRLIPAEARSKPGAGFAAIPGGLGSEDLTGPYEVVKNWPQDISSLAMRSGPTERAKASLRKARIGFTCSFEANCPR